MPRILRHSIGGIVVRTPVNHNHKMSIYPCCIQNKQYYAIGRVLRVRSATFLESPLSILYAFFVILIHPIPLVRDFYYRNRYQGPSAGGHLLPACDDYAARLSTLTNQKRGCPTSRAFREVGYRAADTGVLPMLRRRRPYPPKNATRRNRPFPFPSSEIILGLVRKTGSRSTESIAGRPILPLTSASDTSPRPRLS
jgi:hypothetical protein